MYEATDIKGKPRVGTSEEDLEVGPLAVVPAEIRPRSLGSIDLINLGISIDDIGTGLEDSIDVGGGLRNVPFDIHSETGSFRDCETEPESDDTGNTTETDKETPHEVDRVKLSGVISKEGALVCCDDDKCNDGSG